MTEKSIEYCINGHQLQPDAERFDSQPGFEESNTFVKCSLCPGKSGWGILNKNKNSVPQAEKSISGQLIHDFLKDVSLENMKTKIYSMSYDYLTDLIQKIEALEAKAIKS